MAGESFFSDLGVISFGEDVLTPQGGEVGECEEGEKSIGDAIVEAIIKEDIPRIEKCVKEFSSKYAGQYGLNLRGIKSINKEIAEILVSKNISTLYCNDIISINKEVAEALTKGSIK
ncbi:MAG: hypothetical protein KO464_09930 [Candidatus Methanofastidiosum sp.]|nr:hypothetical protein [Methanofastidiosum sp.]